MNLRLLKDDEGECANGSAPNKRGRARARPYGEEGGGLDSFAAAQSSLNFFYSSQHTHCLISHTRNFNFCFLF